MINNTASLSRAALKTSAASIVLAIGIMSTPSFAQAVAAAEADTGESIIVTGSRISRPDLNTASPIQILGQQEFKLSGAVNVEEVLNDLPQLYPSTTGASNNPGGGVATADLRGLGAQRTLVLVNGRRWMSYDVSQVVDLNTIPAALIKRADVLTGGRGAVYGSDAIAGVINFVLNDEFEGAQIDAGYRINQAGDGQTFNVEATIGTNFANGKGNVTVNGGYTQRDPVFQADRSFSQFSVTDNGDGTTSLGGSGSIPQLRYTINQSTAQAALPGCANTANTRNRLFNSDGTTRQYCSTSDAYNYAPDNYLQVPQERWFMGGFAKYEINEHAEIYTELAFVNNIVNTQLAPTPSGGLSFRIPTNSPFLAASTQAEFKALDLAQTNTRTSYGLVDAPNDGYVTIGQARRFVESGPRAQSYDNSAYRVLGGLRGEISGDWRYDGYYSYSRTNSLNTISGDISQQRIANALDTTGTTLGTVACRGGATGCVPLNFYGAGNISPAAAGYIAYSGLKNQNQITEQVANLSINNGNLFDFGWGAAPVGIAIGAEWRSEAGFFSPDSALSSGDTVGFGAALPTNGQYSVTDLFAELNVPIVADKPGFYNLELNGAYRYSSYSNSVGTASTYSVGGQWAPIKGLTVRGQYQHALRAPSISELFQGNTDNFPSFTDYCQTPVAATNATLKASCIANINGIVPASAIGTVFGSGNTQIKSISGGNANLRAETSNTYTAGVVIVPTQVPALSIAVDYYHITIEGAINPPGATNTRDACFGNAASNYVPYDTSFCALIPRDISNGDINGLIDTNANAGSYKTSGVDANIQYGINANFGFANESKFTLRLSVNYLINFDINTFAAIPALVTACAGHFGQTCGDPYAKWRGSARLTWATGPLTTSVIWRYTDGTTEDGTSGGQVAIPTASAANYFDLSASWNVSKAFTFLFGIDNVLGKSPWTGASPSVEQANTYPSTYDPYGRRFFIGASATF